MPNRGNDRREIFQDGDDYEAFLRVVRETQDACPIRILASCLMSIHWHFLLWPERDGELGVFMQRLTTTHVRRWHLHRHTVGRGHLYQGAYKSFPVQEDEHFYTVCRYAERNALRAQLVSRAERWRWGSLAQRLEQPRGEELPVLARWPVSRPRNWVELVNEAQTERELEAVRLSVQRGRPFGDEVWQRRTAEQLGLEFTLRPRGRPKKR